MADLYIQPELRPVFEAHGLDEFDALFAAGEDRIVDGHAARSVSRLELDRAGEPPLVLYLKRRWGRADRRVWNRLLELKWPRRPTPLEWANACALQAAGVPTAEPVACGADRPGKRSLLAFREVKGPSLAALARDPSDLSAGERRAIARAVGETVRRLHGAGLVFRDLYAKHLFIESPPARESRAVLIDSQRVAAYTPRGRIHDLAALAATTDVPAVTRADLMRFLRAYFGVRRLRYAGRNRVRSLLASVLRRAERIAGRGYDPNLLPERQVAPADMVPLAEEEMTPVDAGRLRINEAFRPHLEAAGLATLDALMRFEGGQAFRDVPGRSTVRTDLEAPDGDHVAVYIKRHRRVPMRLKLRRLISFGEPTSAATTEARNIVRVMDLGIPAMRIVAFGEAFEAGGLRERSCLVTEEVPGATQADNFCQTRYAEADDAAMVREKRRLVRAIARLARRLHAGGLVHRDFYLCHVLVRPRDEDDPILHLIDLQRVRRADGWRAERWIVKDLAAMLFSSRPSEATGITSPVFTNTDRLRFARTYFGVDRLSPDEKRLLRRVIAKAGRIARHDARRRARGEKGRPT